MIKRGFFVIIVFLFLISTNFVYGGEDKVDDVIEERLLSQEKVKVIVVLEDKIEKDYGFFSVEKEVKIEDVVKELSEEEFEKKHEFSIVNGFSGEVTKEGLEKLKENKNIEKVYYDYPVKAFLQDSIPLINADDVHNLQINNINITGKDEIVCIIDTGINYSHVDLGGCSNDTFLDGNCSKVLGGYDFVNNDTDPIDDNGHGTHVAGIIAANGSVIGVAPDAKIVAIKALDSIGEGSASGIIAGIDWCVNNASEFNISIISMSLGDCSNHNTYCNDNIVAPYINSVVEKGIVVTIAAGNCNQAQCPGISCTTGVAAPACVENATPVGAVDKGDSINFQRGAILDLLAPGSNIVSTWNDGLTKSDSGTSMAAPHVAGAVALLQQFNKLQNGTALRPIQIEEILDNTGKLIDDSAGSGYNFSRIDVYEAILSLEGGVPKISINLSSDVLEYNQDNLTINIDYSDSFLDSYSANLTYPDGTLLAEFTTNLNLTTENLTELGTYTITAWCNDTIGNENMTSKTFLVRDTSGLPTLILNYPDDNNFTGNNLVFFNVTIGSKYNLSNATLYHNYTDWDANETLSLDTNETTVEFNASFSEEIYLWGVKACDINNYCVYSENRTFIVDLTKPVVRLFSPANSSSVNALPIDFTFNVTDYGIENCVLIFDGGVNETLSSVSLNDNNVFLEDIYYLSNGGYNWSVNCTDNVGRIGSSDVWNFNLECSSEWTRDCGSWSECSGGSKTRICYDANYCSSDAYNQSSNSGCSSDTGEVAGGGETAGTTETVTTSETESILMLSGNANDVKSFSISKDVGITGMSIELKKAITNAKLTIKKLDSKPSNVPSLDNVNRYIQIDLSGASNDDIKEAIIKFKVAKTWVSANADSVNHVFMHRYYDGMWEKLDTLTAGSDDDYQNYQATTSGFSYFAVNAEKTSTLLTSDAVREALENKTEEVNEANVTRKGFDFRNLFSGNIVKNLRGKINIKNLFSKSAIYNIIFVVVIFLMLIGVTYKYKDIISKGSKKTKGKIKFKKPKFLKIKPDFSKVKFKFDDLKKNIKKAGEKRAKVRAVKIRDRERIKAAKVKIEVAEIRDREEAKIARQAEKKAKLERFEIKDRGNENWEDFDIDSGWDEGD